MTAHRDARPGAPAPASERVRIEARPFTRADLLRRFISAVASLPGVSEAAALGFEHGHFSMQLTYRDAMPLAVRLQQLPGFSLSLETEAGPVLRVVLEGDADETGQD